MLSIPLFITDLKLSFLGLVRVFASFRQALAMDPHLFEHNSSRTGSILQDRTVGHRGRFYFLLEKSYVEASNGDR